MRKKNLTLLLLCIYAATLFSFNGQTILKKVDALLKIRTSLSISRMTITTSSGSSRTFLQWGMALGNRQVTKFTSGFLKEMTMLSLNDGDEIWVYFRSSGRTRRIARHAKNSSFAGSDFSYNDISNTKYSKKYYSQLLRTDSNYHYLKLTPRRNNKSNYSKILLRIRKDNFIPVLTTYFNSDGEKFKQLQILRWEKISGILTPLKMVMKNLNTGSKTTIDISKIKYTGRLRRIFFSSRNLSRSLALWKSTYPFFK